MKQNKTIFLLLFPLCLSFSSCSNKVSTKDPIIDEYKDISFTFCANCDDLTAVVYQELIEEYKKTIDYNVDIQFFGRMGEAGSLYDVDLWLGQTAQIKNYANLGLYAPLYDSFRKEVEDRTNHAVVEHYMKDGKLYAFPVNYSIWDYFFYDSSKLSKEDFSSWTTLINKVKQLNMKISLPISYEPYLGGCYFGSGISTKAEYILVDESDGQTFNGPEKKTVITKVTDNFNSSKAKKVSKALATVFGSGVVDFNGYEPNLNNEYVAVFDYYSYIALEKYQSYFGDNLAYIDIPPIEYEGKIYQWNHALEMNGLIVLEQEDVVKKYEIMQFASYISNQSSQTKLSKILMDKYKLKMTDKTLFDPNDEARLKMANDYRTVLCKPSLFCDLFRSVVDNSANLTDEMVNQIHEEYHKNVMALANK
ncbi:MAG: extracellular solute-binding protein [Bacilli bacterium]|nr:extracellular solute-binding protein [Bacilli bacterium]